MSNELELTDAVSYVGYRDIIPSRPVLEHKSSDNLLDYYQSEDAGRTYHQTGGTTAIRTVLPHSVSSSSSSYSQSPGPSKQELSTSNHEGIAARNMRKAGHIAAAQSEFTSRRSPSLSEKSAAAPIMTRRGVDSTRLDPIVLPALPVVRDDTSSSMKSLSSAPVSGLQPQSSRTGGHQRSHSEVYAPELQEPKPGSVIGMNGAIHVPEQSLPMPLRSTKIHNPDVDKSQASKITRSQSPQRVGMTQQDAKSATTVDTEGSTRDGYHTQSNLTYVDHPYTQLIPVSDPQYLTYVAGIHATAGPLPSPPRNIIPPITSPPPKRPPRLHSPPPTRTNTNSLSALDFQQHSKSSSPTSSLKPEEGHVKHASTSSLISGPTHNIEYRPASPPISLSDSGRETRFSHMETQPKRHTREGAQTGDADTPSVKVAHDIQIMNDLVEAVDKAMGDFTVESDRSSYADNHTDSHNSVSIKPPVRRAASWVSERSEKSSAYVPSIIGSLDPRQHDVTHRDTNSTPHSQERHRTSMESSKDVRRSSSFLSSFHSPSVKSGADIHRTTTHPSRNPRVISRTPQAMQYTDVLSYRTPLERASAYARKINELTLVDCGLQKWVKDMQKRRRATHRDPWTFNPEIHKGARDSAHMTGENKQQRVVSHGSVASEATFPLRADAYIATDLGRRGPVQDEDQMSPTSSLPYPSLARLPSQSHSSVSGTPSLSSPSTPKSPGRFFASIGRMASVKKDRMPNMPATSTNKLIATRSPTLPAQLRPPAKLGPTNVPGGPRSQTGAARSPSLLTHSRNALATIPQEDQHTPPAVARSPSLPLTSRIKQPPVSDAAFAHQVDKLVDVLPHVDRKILAGYLRRAGQDMLAIGQYLEDEKNGAVRVDI